MLLMPGLGASTLHFITDVPGLLYGECVIALDASLAVYAGQILGKLIGAQ